MGSSFAFGNGPNADTPPGLPVRPSAIVIAAVVWNVLLLSDFGLPPTLRAEPGWRTLLAIGLLAVGSWALPHSDRLQSVVMKPGRSTDEIRLALARVRMVSTVLFAGFLLRLVSR
jgi:hypothetical protein